MLGALLGDKCGSRDGARLAAKEGSTFGVVLWGKLGLIMGAWLGSLNGHTDCRNVTGDTTGG